ncbi:MAG: diphthine--ammonia ligase [Thermoactinomyces sp.]
MNKRTALSWSGGKDSCLALDTLVKQGFEVACLVTTVPEELGRTFGHGEHVDLIKLQAESLSIPVRFIQCSLENYTESYIAELKELKEQFHLASIAFGDLYLKDHRKWGEAVATRAGLDACYPLWMEKKDRIRALRKFVVSGYKARVISVQEAALDKSWLGREIDISFLHEIQQEPVCPLGESGEYHTYVYDGPLFSQKIVLGSSEVIRRKNSYKLEFAESRLGEK